MVWMMQLIPMFSFQAPKLTSTRESKLTLGVNRALKPNQEGKSDDRHTFYWRVLVFLIRQRVKHLEGERHDLSSRTFLLSYNPRTMNNLVF